ncbi:MAG: cell division protein ZipA [Rhodanobacter sp.]
MTPQPVLAFAWNPAVGIPLLIGGLIVLALIWLFGQPKKEQGKRRPVQSEHAGERREPTLGDQPSLADDPVFSALDRPGHTGHHAAGLQPEQGELEVGLREELERLGATLSGERHGTQPKPAAPDQPPSSRPPLAGHAASIVDALRAPSTDESTRATSTAATPTAPAPAGAKVAPRSDLGRRPAQLPVERIVTLFVVAREGEHFNGPDFVVAAEKAGLEFGDMGIYHRLVDGKRELGPIFSVANMLKPGSFDLGRLDTLRTPGVSFFMTLPAPLPALDAWDAMLPTTQRLAELLDGLVLDEERNALGRQRIAHIRDQLRGWDRDHEGKEIIFGR